MEQAPKPAEPPKPKSRTMLLAVIIVAILVVVGVGVYFLTKPPPPPPSTGPQVSLKDDGLCSVQANCYFTPATINATMNGPAVTWTDKGTAGHTITTCDSANSPTPTECPTMDVSGLDTFNLSVTTSNPSASHAFAKAGTYYYYCAIHPWMHGEVIVS